MSQPIPPDDPPRAGHRRLWHWYVLLLGATMVTVGVSLIVSVPAGVIVLGASDHRRVALGSVIVVRS